MTVLTAIAKTAAVAGTMAVLALAVFASFGFATGLDAQAAEKNATAGKAPGHAVVLMYHRFGEGAHPSTNIRLEQFEAHLRILSEEGYAVRPLTEILDALDGGKPLPDKTVAITVDDAYRSVLTEAWPRLREKGYPMTLFVATDAIDSGLKGYMSWDEIRTLRDAGVIIGSQTASHPHMPTLTPDAVRQEIETSQARFRAELGRAPALFAYPYGEASSAVIKAIGDAGFSHAFGQHSGVAAAGANQLYLPRFAMNEAYGSAARFRLVTRALPLTVKDVTPADPTLTADKNPPNLGFTLVGLNGKKPDRLACYASGQGKVRVEKLGPTRIEVRMADVFPPGRARINCTLPAGNGRWYWFGKQYYVPRTASR